MKAFGLICNTMIVTSFFMKLYHKVCPGSRKGIGFPKYAIVIPNYYNKRLHEGIVLGYAYDPHEADSICAGTPERTVSISLDVAYGVLGYTKFEPLDVWCYWHGGYPDSIVEWIKHNYHDNKVIYQIVDILNGKLKKK